MYIRIYRSFAEVQSEFARLETVHMLREKARKQMEREQDEMRRMAMEEIRSSVPALSKPAPVRMVIYIYILFIYTYICSNNFISYFIEIFNVYLCMYIFAQIDRSK
jgi:hypothetical protein